MTQSSLQYPAWLFTLCALALVSGCASEAPPATTLSTLPLPAGTAVSPPPISTIVGAVPTAWTVTGSTSFYARLYRSTIDTLDLPLLESIDIQQSSPVDTDYDGKISHSEEVNTVMVEDRIITAVAADLLVQYYWQGSKPLEERVNDLVVWRTDDLIPIPTETFNLKSDDDGVLFDWNEVKLFVRDVALLASDAALSTPAGMEICMRYRPWWRDPDSPTRLPDEETYLITPGECLPLIREVHEAIGRERMLHMLRQDLSLAVYGEEFLWDGQLGVSKTEFRSYDLLLDLAGAGNILGGGSYEKLFESGSQGEQCDSGNCACVYGPVANCGDGIQQGGQEQCDDGNRYPGDGCDEFCQVEQNYCGDDRAQHWEECSEKRECPDGTECGSYADCAIGGGTCPVPELDQCQNLVWKKTCRYSGAVCTSDSDCSCPSFVPASKCSAWKKDSCRFVAGGVCWIGQKGGGKIEGTPCKDQADCSGVSSCTSEGFCTNHPYRMCTSDEQCYSCSSEEIIGTCYDDGKPCNGNEDCQVSGYCMLEPEGICKPRTIGGMGNERSHCNQFCEQNTRCGDGVIYLTENGSPEECDAGMYCEGQSSCYLGQACDDGSTCKARDGMGGGLNIAVAQSSCTADCKLQICGDGITAGQPPEECDNGAQCDDGTPCSLTAPSVCDGIESGACTARSEDGCSSLCKIEECGDSVIQAGLGETCDDGNTVSDDGCDSSCKREYCGDGSVQGGLGEQCDDGNNDATDACVGCRNASCGDGSVWAGNEECDYGSAMNGFGFGVGFGLGCTTSCTIPPPPNPLNCTQDICGNGCVSTSEECDDGNTNSGDGCSGVCKREYCGDNSVDSDGPDNIVGTADDEACDDGGTCFVTPGSTTACKTGDPADKACAKVPFVCNNGGGSCISNADCGSGTCVPQAPSCVAKNCGDGCDNRCQLTGAAGCGNKIVQCDEECDDGNSANGDGCDSSCKLEFCGDGNPDSDGRDNTTGTPDDEQCDAGWSNSNATKDSCRIDCKNFRCGDGVVDSNEECDVPTCKNGLLCKVNADCPNDECKARGGFGCSILCKKEYCGDGVMQDEYLEECDDGNTVSGDGCTSACKAEGTICGNEVTDPEGTDNWPGTADDEECDYSQTTAGVCPDATGGAGLATCDAYGSDNILGTEDDEMCDLGTCNLITKRCSNGNGFVCLTDADCKATCVPSCTPYCKIRAMPCGDGYRDPGEQCDDGNEENGDGCSAPYCLLERPDLCGNGRIDPGEQCDQMSPYQTIECTPFCQFPHGVPQCGDGRKDPSGARRGDLLEEILTFSEGYRLDGRWPAGRETIPNWTAGASKYQSGGGWYVTPRVFDAQFLQLPLVGKQNLGSSYNGPQACSLCGNGVLDTGEQCDSGRLSNGAYPMKRYNAPAWDRYRWSMTYASSTLPNFWKWYQGIFPFGYSSFDSILQHWYLLGNSSYIAAFRGYYSYDYYGGWYSSGWWLSDIKETEKRKFISEACSSSCSLSRCGDDRIDPGESCDDDNREKLKLPPQNGDGCSSTCELEAGFSFSAGTIEWPGGSQQPVCGDDVITIGEQCDDGGVCLRRNGTHAGKYCRLEPGRTFCDLDGIDNKFPSPDDELSCVPVVDATTEDECDETCQIKPLAVCGNEKVEPYEECDLGTKNGTSGASCTSQCMRAPPSGSSSSSSGPRCGDGTVDHGEECDDGNTASLDGCTHCLIDLCGNNLLDAGEHCDDGNRAPGDGCNAWCIAENTCGNGEVDAATNEQCDDGNDFDDDGCSALCKFEYCGDSVPQFGLGEECDRGAQNSFGQNAACRPDCMLPRCGDDIVDSVVMGTHLGKDILYKESCDPGMHCAKSPLKECNDEVDCSLGPCDAASGTCAGDTSRRCEEDIDCGYDACIVQDELNPSTQEVVCTAACTMPVVCGDGLVQGNEECDFAGAGCKDCKLMQPDLCGNGSIDAAAGEKCDDGNRAGHDGCSATCQFESYACPGDCFLAYECTGRGTQTGEVCDPADKNACPGGTCSMRAACAKRCVFGLCGDTTVDPGEQCDDGRHCMHDPSISCSTHADCGAGSCTGADPAANVAGSCSSDVHRACMTDNDCLSICLPTSGDGCSSDCRHELIPGKPGPGSSASLILCQEERARIGVDQVDEWQETLLDPGRNPFIGYGNGGWWSWYWDWNRSDLGSRFSWGIWTWYNGLAFASTCRENPEWCYNRFPNSLGNGVQLVAGSLGAIAQHRTMPDRYPLMPFEPVGVVSYAACQEPRAALATAVEIPVQPPMSIPPYRPAILVREIEKYLCAESGFPRRNFPFLCAPEGVSATSLFGFSYGGVSIQESAQSSLREMILANTLAIGYRTSERILDEYLEEAIQALAHSLESAVQLFMDLERVNFATDECPLDGSTLCM